MRHEKKYRLLECTDQEVRQVLLHHPLSFRKAYPDRYINSLYFDTNNLQSYQENQAGISQRLKYRIRWYGKSIAMVSKPNLEKKIRDNQFGRKETVALPDFKLADAEQLQRIAAAHIPAILGPKVITRYRRSYLISSNQKIRATIDTEVCYYGFNNFHWLPMPHKDPAVILELKCEKAAVDLLTSANQNIPFRITKNSKYVNAIHALYVMG